MKSPLFVVIAGRPCSGKTELSQALAKALKAPVLRFSSFVRKCQEKEGSSLSLADYGENMVATVGPAKFVSGFLDDALAGGKEDLIIIEGLRHWDVGEQLKTLARTFLVFLEVEEDELKRRMMNRDGMTFEQIAERLSHPVESNFEKIRSKSDFVIEGGTTAQNLASLFEKIRVSGLKI